jgi:hypothetical protein
VIPLDAEAASVSKALDWLNLHARKDVHASSSEQFEQPAHL